MKSLEKAFVSFRIGVAQWLSDQRFQELLHLFGRYRNVTDEMTFFTSETHAPLPLQVVEERAVVLARRMAQGRQTGYRTGINILATIGHHNEDLAHSLAGDYSRMTDIDGNVCMGSLCPNDEKVRDYVARLYEIVVAAKPDYIWIDDDIRLYGHLPITCGCFCDNCLSLFAADFGVRYTRESLKEAFNTGPVVEKLTVRKNWLSYNRNTLSRLLALIERTVHDLQPSLPLGFMTGNRFFEGYDFDGWAEILSGPGGAEVMWRPGGGFYSDECLAGLAGKAHDIGRQVSLLPDSLLAIQSEVESFPYQRLQKSAHATMLEAAAYMASGSTGAAFNALSMYDEPLTEYEPLIAKLRDTRPFYDLLAQRLGRSRPLGVCTGWGKDSFAAGNATAGDWLGADIAAIAYSHADEVFALGIPAAYSSAQAAVTLLSGDAALAMKEEELLRILSSGVYMDAQALDRLNEMGYSDLTGFGVERSWDRDCIEEFTDHRLNASFERRNRDGRQSFTWWKWPATALQPLDGKAEVLAGLVDYAGQEQASCCMGVFQNRLGGRICVAGYYPWTFLQNLAKSSQRMGPIENSSYLLLAPGT